MNTDLTLDRGIYHLIITLPREHAIKIGRLGTFCFPAGFYIYIGSAQNNLKQRVKRHLQKKKGLHWHIDYLLQYAEVVAVSEHEGNKAMECTLSHKISTIKNAAIPVKGFGSSDCSCISHLYFFRSNPKNTIRNYSVQLHNISVK
ncbi:MAG: GIY-YIG nuclease family protein [wastewater metagenome]|nr:GIY-YIG nuclease family protein [Candidatus Loosdrechtia aerotolerans]